MYNYLSVMGSQNIYMYIFQTLNCIFFLQLKSTMVPSKKKKKKSTMTVGDW
jgi:hypothetical protein